VAVLARQCELTIEMSFRPKGGIFWKQISRCAPQKRLRCARRISAPEVCESDRLDFAARLEGILS